MSGAQTGGGTAPGLGATTPTGNGKQLVGKLPGGI